MVRRMMVWAALLGVVAGGRATVLIETDFGAKGAQVDAATPDGKSKVSGSLPAPWHDNSVGTWQAMDGRYTPLTENGRGFVRVQKLSGGNLQLQCGLPKLDQPGHYRLTITARSDQRAGPEVGIRIAGPPYTMVYSTRPDLGPDWQTVTRDFALPAQKLDVGVWIVLGDPTSFDLAYLKLERFTDAELIERIKADHPEGTARNLVRISRFPLGLPSGWSLDRANDDQQVAIDADRATTGPSGCASLRLRADRRWLLRSAPFPVPWSFEQHTLSVSLRGDGQPLRLTVLGEGRACAGRTITPTSTWQRVELPFKPVLGGQVHILQLEGSGSLWLDAMQVERGGQAQAYTPQGACEVMLACPAGATGTPGVQFTDEPATVQFAVTGAPIGAVLKATITDLYGETRALPDRQAFGSVSYVRGPLDYAGFAARPHNGYRIEAWVQNAAGERISAPDEVIVYRLPRPRYWDRDHRESAFGIHVLSTTRHLSLCKAVGFNWVRLHDAGTEYMGWSFLEPQRGQWQFFDESIQRYRRHHLSVLALYSTAPHWATGWPKPCSGYFDRYLEPQDLDAWANYVTTVTARYRGQVDDFEVWNEPWGDSFWAVYDAAAKDQRRRSPTAAQDYAKLQAAAYRAGKAANPRVNILGFNSYGADFGATWTKDVMAAGGLDTCDTFSYHKYTSAFLGYPSDDLGTDGLKKAAREIVAAKGRIGKPVWMSEGNSERGGTYDGLYRHVLPYPNRDRYRATSSNICRYVVATLRDGADKLFIYTAHGFSTFSSKPPDWRALLCNDGTLHPSGVALSALFARLEDTHYGATVEVATGVYAYLFAGAGRSVAVLCTGPKHGEYRLPDVAGAKVFDLYGNAAQPGQIVGEEPVYLEANTELASLAAALRR